MSLAAPAAVRLPWPVVGVSSALTAGAVAVFLTGDERTRLAVLASLLLLAAAYVATVHPLVTFAGLVAVLGLLPYVHVPGTGVPVLLVLSVGLWVSLAFLRTARPRWGGPEVAVSAVAAVALLSVAVTGLTLGALTEYGAWLAATAVVLPIRYLAARDRRVVMRVFVLSAAVAAVVGIVLVRIDPFGQLLARLSFAGYDPTRVNVQQVPGSQLLSTRLTGTFVEPNIAGLVLGVGLVLAVAAFRGLPRIGLVGVLGLALVLTLSRSAIAMVVVAALMVVLRVGWRQRVAIVGSGVLAALALLSVPAVRDRLTDSFGPSDTGTLARNLALQDFPRLVDGHWWWGLGWDREEFRDPTVGRIVNFVANAPLLTIYRGGLVLGGVAVLVLLALVLRSWFAARRSFEDAVLCGGVIAFVLVALQLDFPVVTEYPATAVFSLLVGLSWRPPDRETVDGGPGPGGHR